MISITRPITRTNLPEGPRFEDDGSVWEAVPCDPHPVTGKDWRWRPLNLKAFAKECPTGVMTDAPYGSLIRG